LGWRFLWARLTVVMSWIPAPSCWLVVLLVAALAWPAAADAATCCAPGGESQEAASADEPVAACAGCCDEEGETPDPPADDEAPGGCCDDARTCCGAGQPVSAHRGATWVDLAAPSGFLRLARLDVLGIEGLLGLLRPPQH